MTRLIFVKEAGSENFFRNLALDLILQAESTNQAIKAAKLIAASAGLDQEETQELTSWVFAFTLIIYVAAKP